MITNFSDSDTPATVAITGFPPTSGQYYELLPDGTLPGWSGSGDVDEYSILNGKDGEYHNNIDAVSHDRSVCSKSKRGRRL